MMKKPNRKMLKNNGAKIVLMMLTATLLFLSAACQSSLSTANNTAPNKTPIKEISKLEADLNTMKTAGFEHVFVFRRKDGGEFNAEDKTFLKAAMAEEVVNRIILSDDDKAVIAGSHFEFSPKKLEDLRARFDVEDFSTAKKDER